MSAVGADDDNPSCSAAPGLGASRYHVEVPLVCDGGVDQARLRGDDGVTLISNRCIMYILLCPNYSGGRAGSHDELEKEEEHRDCANAMQNIMPLNMYEHGKYELYF